MKCKCVLLPSKVIVITKCSFAKAGVAIITITFFSNRLWSRDLQLRTTTASAGYFPISHSLTVALILHLEKRSKSSKF